MDDFTIIQCIKQLNSYLDSFCREQVLKGELTPSQSFFISYLVCHNSEDGIHPTDWRDISGMSRPAVSSLLKALRQKGYLEMSADVNDDRKKHILPTQKAQDYDKEMHEGLKQTIDCLYRGISDENIKIVEESLGIMLENIKRESKGRNEL
ncbi:MAG: hypothetical protein LUI05_03110 [Oscillospiraceae bacterium]|nr:hypothetical protein [Oscillospiraceae bacterium]